MAGRVASLLLVLLATATPLSARQSDEELRRKIDSLAPLIVEAEAAARAAVEAQQMEKMGEGAVPVDTFGVGPLLVVARREQRGLATAIFSEALESFGPWLDESRVIGDALVAFQWARELVPITLEDEHRRVESTFFRSRAEIVENARHAVGSMLTADLAGSPTAGWFAGPVAEPLEPSRVYRLLASLPAEINQRCLGEGGVACWTALGLDADDWQMDEWYSDDQRRDFAVQLARFFERIDRPIPLGERAVADCVDGGSIAACDQVLRQRGSGRTYAPLHRGDARPAMVYLAMQAGGDGAWARMLQMGEAAPGDALRYASGLSSEELGDLWHAWVLAQRPEVQAGLGVGSLFTLLWILAFAGLAMRSSRWRLG